MVKDKKEINSTWSHGQHKFGKTPFNRGLNSREGRPGSRVFNLQHAQRRDLRRTVPRDSCAHYAWKKIPLSKYGSNYDYLCFFTDHQKTIGW